MGLARHNVEDMLIVCHYLSIEKRTEIDLRDEIEILRNIYDKETKAASKEEEFDPGDINEIFDDIDMRICSYGNNRITCRPERDTWIVDGDYIYLLN